MVADPLASARLSINLSPSCIRVEVAGEGINDDRFDYYAIPYQPLSVAQQYCLDCAITSPVYPGGIKVKAIAMPRSEGNYWVRVLGFTGLHDGNEYRQGTLL